MAFVSASERVHTRRDHAPHKMEMLARAARVYRAQFGVWPTLDDLVRGPRPFLEDGERGVTDPWGKRFVLTAAGESVTVSTVDGEGRPLVWPE